MQDLKPSDDILGFGNYPTGLITLSFALHNLDQRHGLDTHLIQTAPVS